jgi:hypothetical protein
MNKTFDATPTLFPWGHGWRIIGSEFRSDPAEQWVGCIAVIALVVERFRVEGDSGGYCDLLRR